MSKPIEVNKRPRYATMKSKLRGVCRSIDYKVVWFGKIYARVYDVTGNDMGEATVDEWLLAIKKSIRSTGRY